MCVRSIPSTPSLQTYKFPSVYKRIYNPSLRFIRMALTPATCILGYRNELLFVVPILSRFPDAILPGVYASLRV